MPIWWVAGGGTFNPYAWFIGYFAGIAYLAATNPNAYPPGSMGNM